MSRISAPLRAALSFAFAGRETVPRQQVDLVSDLLIAIIAQDRAAINAALDSGALADRYIVYVDAVCHVLARSTIKRVARATDADAATGRFLDFAYRRVRLLEPQASRKLLRSYIREIADSASSPESVGVSASFTEPREFRNAELLVAAAALHARSTAREYQRYEFTRHSRLSRVLYRMKDGVAVLRV